MLEKEINDVISEEYKINQGILKSLTLKNQISLNYIRTF